jgi:hypothetical protein
MKKELELYIYATARSSCVGCDTIAGNDRLFCIAYLGVASRAADAHCLGKKSDADDTIYAYTGTFSHPDPYYASYANSYPHDGAYANSYPFSHRNILACRDNLPHGDPLSHHDPFPHADTYRE